MSAVLIPTASEAEWLDARRKGITASEIAIVMGLSPYSSPYALYHQKLGILPDGDDNLAMERGRILEPYIAEKFAAAHPEFAILGSGRELYARPDRDWQMATPDRMVHGLYEAGQCTCGAGLDGYGHERGCGWELDEPVAVLETKTDSGSGEWGEPGTDEIPVHYRCQVLWQMDVLGVSRAYVACLNIPRWEIREYVIEHDPAVPLGYDVTHTLPGALCDLCTDILAMHVAATEFLERIDRQEPPDVDWRPATIDSLKALHPSVEDTDAEVSVQLAAWYHAACRNHKHWEQRKKLYEARIREQAASFHRLRPLHQLRRRMACGAAHHQSYLTRGSSTP